MPKPYTGFPATAFGRQGCLHLTTPASGRMDSRNIKNARGIQPPTFRRCQHTGATGMAHQDYRPECSRKDFKRIVCSVPHHFLRHRSHCRKESRRSIGRPHCPHAEQSHAHTRTERLYESTSKIKTDKHLTFTHQAGTGEKKSFIIFRT